MMLTRRQGFMLDVKIWLQDKRDDLPSMLVVLILIGLLTIAIDLFNR